MRVIRQADFTAIPWKNGGGITREVWRVPAAGRFSCRLSVAQIDRAGPFSDFAGYERTLVLLRGAGVRLSFGGGQAAALRDIGAWVAFDGGMATDCDLAGGGPCTDLNFMVCNRVAGVRAGVERVPAARALERSPTTTLVVFAVRGSVVLNAGAERAVLDTWDCAVVAPSRAVATTAASLEPTADEPAPLVFLATLDDNSLWV
jgi:environmental stress-induced protein Ves